jgi:DNA-binding response OmpR family regulator
MGGRIEMVSPQVIYMMNGRGADPAILKGLNEAGCQVRDTHGVAETLNSLRYAQAHAGAQNVLLVAEVHAGAIPLLTLLHETSATLPPTLLFDQEGNSIHAAIKAIKLGVQEYVLATEPASQRELRARLLAERLMVKGGKKPLKAPLSTATVTSPLPTAPPVPTARKVEASLHADFVWDPEGLLIYIKERYVRLSPVEGRVFDLLLTHRNQTVTMHELIRHGLMHENGDSALGVKLLRPHMMRLRSKLERYSELARRIINVRGDGYMFI